MVNICHDLTDFAGLAMIIFIVTVATNGSYLYAHVPPRVSILMVKAEDRHTSGLHGPVVVKLLNIT